MNPEWEKEARYYLSPSVYENFLESFHDTNRLHVDEVYAKSKGFAGVVTHGAILQGFLSHFVGMVLPAGECLLVSTDLRYKNPCFVGDKILIRGRIAQRSESVALAVVDVEIFNETQGNVSAKGRVQVKDLHE